MGYFNYHAKAKNLIRNKHCIKAEIVLKYNQVCPALVLYFDCNIAMPIRQHRWGEYFELLKQFDIEISNKKDMPN